MPSGVYTWSQTAATNATADSAVNWSEGQAPSSINDSARALMASLAKWRDDISGAITTGGTGTAFTVTSNSSFDSLAHMGNQIVAFVPHTTNTGTSTLNVDSLGAKPIRSAPSVELPSGTLIQGTPYLATYNASDAVWYLHGSAAFPYLVPLGSMLPYTGSTAPNSAFVLPYGQAISRTTYASYFSLVSTTFGSGDGSTTFNVPDLRGRVWAGLDNMGGSSADRLSGLFTSTTLGNTFAGSVTVAQANLPNVNFTVTDPGHFHATWDANGTIVYGAIGAQNTAAPAAGAFTMTAGFAQLNTYNTGSKTTGISVASGGSGTALATAPPTMVGNFILRII